METKTDIQKWWKELGIKKTYYLRQKYFPDNLLIGVSQMEEIYRREHTQPQPSNTVSRTQERTPGEWYIQGNTSNIILSLIEGEERRVNIGRTNTGQDAGFICRAVNNHEALVNACHTILSNFKANVNFGTTPNKQELEAGINILTAAITNATKGQ